MNTVFSNNPRLKKIQYIKEKSPAKAECEDALLLNDNASIFGVMDGSTPIDHYKDKNGHNSAYLAANFFKQHLESLDQVDYLHHQILKVNKLLQNEMEKNLIETRNKAELWSTCISAIQIKKNTLVYASLGDTMILTSNKYGKVNVLTVNTVKNINARAKLSREIKRDHDCGFPDETYFQKEQNKITYHRQMANTPNGYSIANGMEEAQLYIQHGMVNIENLKHVLLMSDGMFNDKNNLKDVYSVVNKIGLNNYVKKLLTYEKENDISADDKTAILLTF